LHKNLQKPYSRRTHISVQGFVKKSNYSTRCWGQERIYKQKLIVAPDFLASLDAVVAQIQHPTGHHLLQVQQLVLWNQHFQ
jgi:hypothetical protein